MPRSSSQWKAFGGGGNWPDPIRKPKGTWFADAGGSNGSRSRTWKLHPRELADELWGWPSRSGLPARNKQVELRSSIGCCHFTSLTWKGPLVDYGDGRESDRRHKTKNGLQVKAVLPTNTKRHARLRSFSGLPKQRVLARVRLDISC